MNIPSHNNPPAFGDRGASPDLRPSIGRRAVGGRCSGRRGQRLAALATARSGEVRMCRIGSPSAAAHRLRRRRLPAERYTTYLTFVAGPSWTRPSREDSKKSIKNIRS
jgi:hypothetical protein